MVLSGLKVKELVDKSNVQVSSELIALELLRSQEPVRFELVPNLSERKLPYAIESNKTFLRISPELGSGQIGRTSVDLRLGTLVAWSDVIAQNVTLDDLRDMPHKELEIGEPFTFQADPEGNKVYYVTTLERVSYSSDLEMHVDSKSTTGRVGCMTHFAGSLQDRRLVTILQPYAFNLIATAGKSCLSQACFRYKNSSYLSLQEIMESGRVSFRNGVKLADSVNSRGLLLSFAGSLAYRARENLEPIDMDARDLDWRPYFGLIESDGEIAVGSKTLYLLGSREDIALRDIMGRLSREEEVLTGSGTWGHFAGFVQPGFEGQITLEVYGFSKKRIRTGDGAGVISFDGVEGRVDTGLVGNYHGQRAPRLPKMFKID